MNRLERQATEADSVVKDLETQLADPEVFGDIARMNDLVGEYETAQRRAERLLAEWEQADAELTKAQSA